MIPATLKGVEGWQDYPLQARPRYAAWLFFSKTWTSLYGQFEEEAPPQDVEAQAPQAFEV